MARTKEDMGGEQNPKRENVQGVAEHIVHKEESERTDADNGPNPVSNGTESTPREPGIARVGNTSPDEEETH